MQTSYFLQRGRSSRLRTAAFSLIALLSVSHRAAAQCTTSNLIINTAQHNYMSLAAGVADPRWTVSDKGPAYIPGAPPLGANAMVVVPLGSWPGTGWISDNQQHANPGVPANSSNYMTFKRTFTLCAEAEVTFDMDMRIDNYVQAIMVDGVVVPGFSQPYTSSIMSYSATFSQVLGSGTHSLEIKVGEDNNMQSNPVGMALLGTITASSSVIVNDFDANCDNYDCGSVSECNDKCYWRVTGNNIAGGNNTFGTLTDHAVKIVTNGMQRGIIQNGSPATGGFFGWNTMAPTARFHVNCINGNDGIPSDIRFENLERGRGSLLVIDHMGYVYNSQVDLQQLGFRPAGESDAMQQEIDELKAKVEALQGIIATGRHTADVATGNELFQNAPNPFGTATTIEYNVTSMKQSAHIIIYDLNGRELMKFPTPGKGKGRIVVEGKELQPGMYLYSLVVDGREADTKKMIVSR